MGFRLKNILFLMLFLSPFFVQAANTENHSHKTVCLNMIVKNESAVIERCLNSTLPMIDYWVIVDTGSTDGTQQIIKDFMQAKGVPGELHERPWKNFAHNRNEALQLAKGKGDYVFFIDADEYLEYEPGFKRRDLNKDCYFITVSYGGTRYARSQLINNHLDWKWYGVLHEWLDAPGISSRDVLEKVLNVVTSEGCRSQDPLKYQKDAQILEEALKEEPENSRYVFYLAQSYRDAGNHALALKNYEKYFKMNGGWDQEKFWALLEIANMQQALEMPLEVVVNAYRKAFNFRRTRLEPLYYLARYYRLNGDCESGYRIAKLGLSIPESKDMLFVQKWMYDWGILLEFSASSYWVGHYEESRQACERMLSKADLPDDIRELAEKNLGFANAKLCDQVIEKTCKLEESAALK